jgi:hypothetical protein
MRQAGGRPKRRWTTLRSAEAECLVEALRAIGTDIHVSQFAALDMRKVAALVKKGHARWTAYGVKKVKRR